ncbi:MAG: YqgE/AlgH family protein [Pseudomonadota bacterium]
MSDPFFEKTLILLCQHDDNGALGLVVNRTTSLSVQTVIEQLGLSLDQDFAEHRVSWGGPVEPGAGFIVYRGVVPSDEGWNVGERLAVSPSRERLMEALGQPEPFLLCLGYAGWGPGQLDREIGTGSWLVADVEPEVVLETDPDERYERALAQLGLTRNRSGCSRWTSRRAAPGARARGVIPSRR